MEQVIKTQTEPEKKQSELELDEDPILNGCHPIKTWEEEEEEEYDEEDDDDDVQEWEPIKDFF